MFDHTLNSCNKNPSLISWYPGVHPRIVLQHIFYTFTLGIKLELILLRNEISIFFRKGYVVNKKSSMNLTLENIYLLCVRGEAQMLHGERHPSYNRKLSDCLALTGTHYYMNWVVSIMNLQKINHKQAIMVKNYKLGSMSSICCSCCHVIIMVCNLHMSHPGCTLPNKSLIMLTHPRKDCFT